MLGLLILAQLGLSQNLVPNAGFENWTDNQPDLWNTSNFVNGNYDNVTPVEPGYSGTFAVKGEVRVWPNTPGFPLIPQLISKPDEGVFPITELFPTLSLHYKFHPGQEGDVFTVFIGILAADGSSFGAGQATVSTPQDTFSLLSVPIYYNLEGDPQPPYRAIISMAINTEGPNLPAIGGYFIVDELVLGDQLSGKPDQQAETFKVMAAYPNPTGGSLNIPVKLKKGQIVAIDLYDLTGRRVATLHSGNLSEGEHLIQLDLPDLPNGTYLCRLQTPGGVATQKIRLIRS